MKKALSPERLFFTVSIVNHQSPIDNGVYVSIPT
jgi:hypothetical protein